MGVSGLAEGFLAGFNSMNSYQRSQKEEARMDQAMSLRDAKWQNEQLRQQVADERYRREREYSKGRDTVADERYEREFTLQEQEARGLREYRNAQLGLAQAEEGRRKKEYEWQVQARDKQAFQQENLPVIQSGWQAVAEGRDPGQPFWDVVRDKRASPYNPERYMQQDYAEAGKTFVTYAGKLMRLAQAGKLDPGTPQGHALINAPTFIKAAGTLYQDEVNKGVGDIDPGTGKTITAKQLSNIMLSPDAKGVVLGVEVTYEDGSKHVRPVTQQRTSAPDDHPKVIPLNDFLKPAYQRAALSRHMVANADQLRMSLGLTTGPDQAGYKKAVTALEQQHGQNRARLSSSNAEDKDMQLDALDSQLEQSKAALAETYGMTRNTDAPTPSPPIKAWTGDDPLRLQFVKEASQHGKLGRLLENPAIMNTAFELWRGQAEKQKKAEQASVTAQRLRDNTVNAYKAMGDAQTEH